jgi:hypothetical protein
MLHRIAGQVQLAAQQAQGVTQQAALVFIEGPQHPHPSLVGLAHPLVLAAGIRLMPRQRSRRRFVTAIFQ